MTVYERITKIRDGEIDLEKDSVEKLIYLAYYMGREEVANEISDKYSRHIAEQKERAAKCRYHKMVSEIVGPEDYIYSPDYSKQYFVRVCVNGFHAADKNGKKPMLYRRNDLTAFAEQAFREGKKYFYARPVDKDNPYGRMELCGSEYRYMLKRPLTEDEYQKLFGMTENSKSVPQ